MRKRFDTPEAEQLRESAQPDQRRTESSVRPKAAAHRGRVLVVDDSDDARGVMAAILQLYGFDVLVAQDGEEGFAFYASLYRVIDVVLLDMQMPGMDGADTFRKLKTVNPSVKAILCSGAAASERIEQAMRDGASGFLAKPFSPDALLDSVNRVLGASSDEEPSSRR